MDEPDIVMRVSGGSVRVDITIRVFTERLLDALHSQLTRISLDQISAATGTAVTSMHFELEYAPPPPQHSSDTTPSDPLLGEGEGAGEGGPHADSAASPRMQANRPRMQTLAWTIGVGGVLLNTISLLLVAWQLVTPPR